MRDAGRDEHDRSRPHVTNLVADADPPGTGDDVVGLVLSVWLLEIGLTRGQDVESDAQVRNADEFQVRRSGGRATCGDIVELVGVHSPTITGVDRAVGAGTASFARTYPDDDAARGP